MSTFPIQPIHARELRALFAGPTRWLGRIDETLWERLADLVRWTTGVEGAGLVTGAGSWGSTELTDGIDLTAPPTDAADRIVIPLRVPLAPSGVGSQRLGAALVLPAGAEGDLERLERHATAILIEDALRRIRESDPLTELPGRAAFERTLRETTPHLAADEPVAVMLFDVDRLRDLNLALGRSTGDDLLRTLGAILGAGLKGRGAVARFGGDELALLAVGLDAAEQDRLLGAIGASLRALEGFGDPRPTVSIGVACSPADDMEQLLLRADQALAQAKDEGRGRTVAWQPGLMNRRRRDLLAGVLTGHPVRDQRNTRHLLETVEAVAGLAPLEATQEAIVRRCIEVADAERGLLILRSGDGWTVRLARDARGADLSTKATFAASIATEALAQGRTVSRLAEGEAISASAETLGLSAVLCAPLVGEDVPAGVVYVDTQTRAHPYDSGSVAFFDALTRQLGTTLRNAALYDRLLDRAERLQSDVAGREAELVRARRRFAELSGRVDPIEGLIGRSPAMQQVFRLLDSLKGTEVAVVVEGESGTGKELVSRAIHAGSGRSGPLVTVNCAAVAESLFESELFGHVDGAFTGAQGDREGLLEAAHGGTLFMDEVGELPLEVQAKLLRALQEGEVRRIGDSTVRPIDVRIVAATNRDLRAMVDAGEFREDLYYRLAVFRVPLPPLRARTEDIPAIAEAFVAELSERSGRVVSLCPATLKVLLNHTWPGNVRQLRNVLERGAVLSADGVIREEHVEAPPSPVDAGRLFDEAELLALPLKAAKTLFAKRYTEEMIRRADGSIPEAAKLAGVTRQTLYRILAP